MITVEYEPTVEELRQSFEINRRTPIKEWVSAVAGIVVGALGIVRGLTVVGVILVALSVALIWFITRGIPAAAEKSFARTSAPTKLVIDETGITRTRTGDTQVVPWSTVRRALENEYAWAVISTPVIIGTVLKRAMTPDQRREFSLLLAEHLGKRVVWRGEPTEDQVRA